MPSGVPLPFSERPTLVELGGDTVDVIECSPPWPVGSPTETRGGEAYDHDAQAPAKHEAALRVSNRALVFDGKSYRIVEAISHTILPHVSLRLREVRSGGV